MRFIFDEMATLHRYWLHRYLMHHDLLFAYHWDSKVEHHHELGVNGLRWGELSLIKW